MNLNLKEKNIPKLQEEFMARLKNLLIMAKLNVEKQAEHIIIITIEAKDTKLEANKK